MFTDLSLIEGFEISFILSLQDFQSLVAYLQQFPNERFLDAASDFHFLIYIATMDMLPLKVRRVVYILMHIISSLPPLSFFVCSIFFFFALFFSGLHLSTSGSRQDERRRFS